MIETPEPLSIADTDEVGDEVVTVMAHVVTSGGVTTVSDQLAESHPPQPGGRWLVVANPEALTLEDTSTFESTEWTNAAIPIAGRRIDDTFLVEPVARRDTEDESE